MTRIVELSASASELVLHYLTTHVANADYMPHRRVMHRATTLGGTPFDC